MFRIIREISATVRMANQIAAAAGEGPRWTLFLTNRSFILQCVATGFALLGMFGVFLPIDAADLAETIGMIGFVAAQAWALFERLRGKTRAIWSPQQADKALQEADALSAALKKAGA